MRTDTTIVDLNNAAVSHLQEGNYRAAVWDLDVSLSRLQYSKKWDFLEPPTYEANALCVTSVPIAPAPRDRKSVV